MHKGMNASSGHRSGRKTGVILASPVVHPPLVLIASQAIEEDAIRKAGYRPVRGLSGKAILKWILNFRKERGAGEVVNWFGNIGF
jgi:hypothetical protein